MGFQAELQTFLQYTIQGLTTGSLFALIALGYTMVYGIVELINFAHGDLFMLGAFLALTILAACGLGESADPLGLTIGLAACFAACPVCCAALNVAVDRAVYRPLRNAPRLAPLVSAIGVSFIFMNVGLFWRGPQDVNFPNLIPDVNLLGDNPDALRFTAKDLLVIGVTVPLMAGLYLFVKFAPLGKAMRATAQDPVAAQLMGIDTERVIGATFALGGSLAGAASVVYGLVINTVSYQMGYTNGLFAFTAAVLGGIGNIPGAVLGGLMIGLVKAYGSGYVGERWSTALIFAVLIVILVFRPSGLLGSRVREKV